MEGEDMSFSDCERDSKYCCVLLEINLVAENAHNILAAKKKNQHGAVESTPLGSSSCYR